MAIRREWLEWKDPCLPQAAAWLLDRAAEAGHSGLCDLQQITCVVPGLRAGRMLLAELIEQCKRRERSLIPPRVMTPGMLLEELTKDQPAASPLEVVLAWMNALREADREAIKPLLPYAPAHDDTLAWHELASTLAQLHSDLAGGMVEGSTGRNGMFARVAETAERLEMFAEGERWKAMDRVYGLYREALKDAKLLDPHAARLDGVQRRAEAMAEHCEAGREIVLIGVVELNAVQRLMIASTFSQATALVHAPQALADRFDEFGCVIPEAWSDVHIGLDDAQIHVVDRPDDQAQRALDVMASFDGGYAAQQITLGVGDETMNALLQRAAERAGLELRPAAGTPMQQTAPVRFLHAAAEWLNEPRFANFAALLRHPDVEQWLIRAFAGQVAGIAGRQFVQQFGMDEDAEEQIDTDAAEQAGDDVGGPADSDDGELKSEISNLKSCTADWLSLLDSYFSDHLHERLTGTWLGDPKRRGRLKAVYEYAHQLLAPLLPAIDAESGKKTSSRRPLAEWGVAILQTLATLYCLDPSIDCDDPPPLDEGVLDACLAIRERLAEFAAVPESLQPRTDAAGAIRLLLLHANQEMIAPQAKPDQIEMLGWFELHLDPAPALIITGFNEGCIPRSSPGSPFLPDSLRAALGLPTSAQRYARDAYFIEAIRHNRERLDVIAGRHASSGDPLTPSRLLLACDAQTLVRRVQMMCAEPERSAPGDIEIKEVRTNSSDAGVSNFRVPALPRVEPPKSMRVTAFRNYLACPYRYALGELLELEGFDDHAVEMDPLQFGTLAHDVLREFGRDSTMSLCTEPQEIEQFLLAQLGVFAARKFGRHPIPAVLVQLARLEARLRSFARFQADRCAQGWRIRHCEYEFKETIALDIPSQEPMLLRGKIDRIDFNERTGEWLILDYKTSESGELPHQSHHGRKNIPDDGELEWLDLQLPLYHYLATRAKLGVPTSARLGYICLPKQTDGTCLHLAEWTAEHLDDAVETARDIVRNIRAGAFEINLEYDNPHDAYSRICQTTVFTTRDADGEGGGDGGSEP